ncbi:MAG: 16S rRNA (cytosine(1402)-N(4))-methyltransferase RsmH [Chloroflexi bacterium]|nr:16S rRNA (cytosine(1402)-N(4))-methyltransferase RsmH [Chloroflexota bacterium]
MLKYLPWAEGKVILDLTLGMGGYAKTFLENSGTVFFIGVDLDEEALEIAENNLKDFHNKILIRENFKNIPAILEKAGVEKVDGILGDLGLSSLQLDATEKGFSYRGGLLDMRFSKLGQNETAKDLVNRLPERELADLIYKYSQEKYSRRIASAIVRERRSGEITDAKRLSDIIVKSIPAVARHGKIHAATKTFMALRMAVNMELENLQEMLPLAWEALKPGGRMVILAYHSMEDRIVKNFMRERRAKKKCAFDGIHDLIMLTPSPVRPGDDEIARNPRSRSARLRAAEKISGGD